MKAKEYRALAAAGGKPKRPKFGNKKVVLEDGTVFDSKREYKRWVELQGLERAGAILNLGRQSKFVFRINGVRVASYTADFVYDDVATGRFVVEDSKGRPDDRWPMKKKLMLAVYGVEVKVT